jgi:hypothetical protein
MARLAAVLALALVAGAAVAEARLALCNSNARPAAPTMVKITRNMITPQGAGESGSRVRRALHLSNSQRTMRIAKYVTQNISINAVEQA